MTSDGRRTVGLELASDEAQEVRLRWALSRYLRRIGEEPPKTDDILAFSLASRRLLAAHGE